MFEEEPAAEADHEQGYDAVFLGAVATSSCSIEPQIVFSLGIGAGPWIANLTALAPYKPLSVAGTARFLDYHFYLGLLGAQGV